MLRVKSRTGRIAATASIACAALLAHQPTPAQEAFPDHAVRLIVPFPPGGQTDNVARHLGAKITPILGQQLVVDNRGGAAGTIGSAEVARAKPDGYTILIATSSTHAINPPAMPNMPYDAVKDFAPIVVLGTGPIALSVHPIVPAQTLQQLIALAKARPGLMSYGSSGVGSINDQLNGAVGKVMADRAFIDTLVKLGVDPIVDSGPDKAAAMIKSELARWSPIIQAVGLAADAPTRSAPPRR